MFSSENLSAVMRELYMKGRTRCRFMRKGDEEGRMNFSSELTPPPAASAAATEFKTRREEARNMQMRAVTRESSACILSCKSCSQQRERK